jgi:putative DNA primase/helicase
VNHDASWDYFVLPEAWKEICKGHDPQAIAQALADAGLLVRGAGGRLSISAHIPQHGQLRLYHLKSALLGGGRRDE